MNARILADELLEMAAEDGRMRAKLIADGSMSDDYHPAMQAVHDKNAARLTEIINLHGWPGRTLVSDEASRAAWLILQHAIAHPDLQRRGLVLLREAAARGDVAAVEVAMLEDRICLFEGRPQKYGTQFGWNEDGELVPWVIEDEQKVEERRRAVGLPQLAENVRSIREGAERDGDKPPQDWKEHHRRFVEWARSVGWRIPG